MVDLTVLKRVRNSYAVNTNVRFQCNILNGQLSCLHTLSDVNIEILTIGEKIPFCTSDSPDN